MEQLICLAILILCCDLLECELLKLLFVLLTIILFHFFFLCVYHSDSSIFLFLGASIVCVNNLKKTADLVPVMYILGPIMFTLGPIKYNVGPIMYNLRPFLFNMGLSKYKM